MGKALQTSLTCLQSFLPCAITLTRTTVLTATLQVVITLLNNEDLRFTFIKQK